MQRLDAGVGVASWVLVTVGVEVGLIVSRETRGCDVDVGVIVGVGDRVSRETVTTAIGVDVEGWGDDGNGEGVAVISCTRRVAVIVAGSIVRVNVTGTGVLVSVGK